MTLVSGSARPPGYAPRGTSFGLVGFTLLSGGVPFLIMQSLVPVVADGIDLWMRSLLPALAWGFMLILGMALGLHRRRRVFILYLFWTGSLLVAGYFIGVAIGILVLLRIVPLHDPSLHFMSIVNIIMWTLLLPGALLLGRMLRLRYWQPWSTAEQWEPGNETTPLWAKRFMGLK